MASFKVPCPSCENQVLITDPSAIGTKVECPKCKYRFKAEEPAGGFPKDDSKAAKGKSKEKKKAEPTAAGGAKKKNSKKLVAIVVGVLAVGVLAVVGFAMMSGDKKPAAKGGGGGVPAGGSPGGTGDGDGTDPKDKDKGKDKGTEKDKEVLDPKRKTFGASTRDESASTNLLPNETVALYRFDPSKVRQTPLGMLFDPVTIDMFRSSFGFELSDVAAYYHAYVGKTRDPFGVFRLKYPVAAVEVLPQQFLAGAPKEIKKRKLFAFKSNPFITGVANAFSMSSLFGDYLEKLPIAPAIKPAEKQSFGVCVYDSQHVIVAEFSQLEKFLLDLDDKGNPKFLSVVGTPLPGSTAQIAENPLYLSIDPKLKRVLQEVGSEFGNPAAIIYAERLEPGLYDAKLLKSEYQPVTAVLEPVLNRTRFIAGSLNVFTPKQMTATIRLTMDSEASAVDAVKEHLTPGLTSAALAMTLFLNTPVEFRNLSSGGPIMPGGGFPPGIGFPPGVGFPPGIGFPPGGTMPPGPGSGRPGAGSRPGAGPPPPPPPGGAPTISGSPMQPPGGYRPPGGTGDGTPPGPGTPTNDPNLPVTSHIDLTLTDHVVTLTLDLQWSDDTYRRIIAPRVMGMTSTAKGKMAVFASNLSYHALSDAVLKMTAATKQFPRGTIERRLDDVNRMGLKYQPQTRVSFFVELLPYLSRDRAALARDITNSAPWFEGANLAVAEAWVPELLVPTYPQTAWRATSPFVSDGRVMGGTNYVAIAGIGMDAARYNPKSEADAKKMGITGYEWGSSISEVKDGLANTIYLMQTPPGLQQPWLAGGGATIRGLDENDPMKVFRHKFGTGDKEGTYALMGDGSVRFIPGDIKVDLLLAMATRAGGETFVADRIDKEAPLVFSKKKDAELRASAEPTKLADPKEPVSGTKPDDAPGPREKK